ncbi:hypothetical protein IC582_005591 [Cucumis melo]
MAPLLHQFANFHSFPINTDSLIKPVTRIIFGVAIITILITFLSRDSQGWMKKLNITGNFPPWILACVVIVFTRSRKRTRDLLKKYGW